MIPIFDQITEVKSTAYRNIMGVPADFDEFDDLTSNIDAKKYAHQLTSVTSEKLQPHYQAIDYIFEQSSWLPTRYGTGEYPVWYGSLDLLTCFYETLYHWKRVYLVKPDFKSLPETIRTLRSVYTVECNAALIDLRNKTEKYPELIQPEVESYDMTQKWGVRMYKEGYPGLLASSARMQHGENIVVFKKSILSHAKHYQDYTYEYNFANNQESVITNITQKVILTR